MTAYTMDVPKTTLTARFSNIIFIDTVLKKFKRFMRLRRDRNVKKKIKNKALQNITF